MRGKSKALAVIFLQGLLILVDNFYRITELRLDAFLEEKLDFILVLGVNCQMSVLKKLRIAL